MAARSKKKKRSIIPILLGVGLLLLIVAGFYWFSQNRPERFRQFASLFTGEVITNTPPASPATNRPTPGPTRQPIAPLKANLPPSTPATNQAAASSNKNEFPPAVTETRLGPTRPVNSVLEAQIALARIGISTGCIDGGLSENTRRALLAWQIHHNLPVSGELDAESKAALMIEEPIFQNVSITQDDLARIKKIPATWLGKSEEKKLDYESILELLAEKGRSTTAFIQKLNPGLIWTNLAPGTLVKIPRVPFPSITEKAAFVRVHLYSKTIDVFGKSTNLLAHFPCSIAKKVEKRPIGTLHVAKAAANPSYLFDPAVFTESDEARKLGRKLVIPPGPNNPVGSAWIGLDRPGYGIHGTPKPEQIGRTESHGCFRLANWNADHLLQLSWAGMPVIVEP